MKTASFKSFSAPASFRARILTALIAPLVCLVVPAAVLMLLGMSRLTLTRQDNTVTATVQHLVFFAVPWKTESLSGITAVEHKITKGERLKRKNGQPDRHNRHAMDNGSLILTGPAGQLTVAADPSRIVQAETGIKAFLTDSARQSHRQFLMGNRLFGWLFGIPATLLALLYATGAVLAIGQWLRQFMSGGRRRTSPVSGKSPAGTAAF